MKIDSGIGYIFSKYEIMYILRAMGARYCFGEIAKENISSKEVSQRAEKGLIEKDYIFRDIFDNIVLNKEITEYFKPVANPEKAISCKKVVDGMESSLIFYIKDNVCISAENNNDRNNSYIFSYSENKKIYDNIINFCEIGEISREVVNDKIIMDVKQYKLMQELLKEKDSSGFRFMLSDYDIKNELLDEIKSAFLNEGNTLAFSFCCDCKKNKTDYIFYIVTEKYIWAITPDTRGKMIRISSVTKEDIVNKIYDVMSSEFDVRIDELQLSKE